MILDIKRQLDLYELVRVAVVLMGDATATSDW